MWEVGLYRTTWLEAERIGRHIEGGNEAVEVGGLCGRGWGWTTSALEEGDGQIAVGDT